MMVSLQSLICETRLGMTATPSFTPICKPFAPNFREHRVGLLPTKLLEIREIALFREN